MQQYNILWNKWSIIDWLLIKMVSLVMLTYVNLKYFSF